MSAVRSSKEKALTVINTKPSGGFVSKASESSKVNSELRDLKLYCDQLYKEIERKDARNDTVTKEMQTLRLMLSNLQRELKMISIAYEKVKEEKFQFSSALTKAKDEIHKLTEKVHYYEDTNTMSTQIDRNKIQSVILKEDIYSLRGAIQLRDQKIVDLERELEIARRSLAVQDKYEHFSGSHTHHQSNSGMFSDSSGTSGGGSSREIMRSLYYELGKRQTDLHSMSISLAETHKDIETTRAELERVTLTKETLSTENKQFKSELENLNKLTTNYHTEIESLHNTITQQSQSKQKMQIQIDDFNRKMHEMRSLHEEVCSEHKEKLNEMTVLLTTSDNDKKTLHNKLESLQKQMLQYESAVKTKDAKLEQEINAVIAENQDLREKLTQREDNAVQIDIMRNNLFDALKQNEHYIQESTKDKDTIALYETNLIPSLQYNLQNLNARILSYETELNNVHESENKLIVERNEAIDALQQTINAAKDMSIKYQQEHALRLAAEQNIAAIQRAKENVSASVLEALQKERQKCVDLERTLQSMPPEQRYSRSNSLTNVFGLPSPLLPPPAISTNNTSKTTSTTATTSASKSVVEGTVSSPALSSLYTTPNSTTQQQQWLQQQQVKLSSFNIPTYGNTTIQPPPPPPPPAATVVYTPYSTVRDTKTSNISSLSTTAVNTPAVTSTAKTGSTVAGNSSLETILPAPSKRPVSYIAYERDGDDVKVGVASKEHTSTNEQLSPKSRYSDKTDDVEDVHTFDEDSLSHIEVESVTLDDLVATNVRVSMDMTKSVTRNESDSNVDSVNVSTSTVGRKSLEINTSPTVELRRSIVSEPLSPSKIHRMSITERPIPMLSELNRMRDELRNPTPAVEDDDNAVVVSPRMLSPRVSRE